MNVINIDLMLFKLIKKYDIYKYIPEAEASYIKDLSWEILNNKIESFSDDRVIALRGGGPYAYAFWNKLSDNAKKKISYIIDRNMSIKLGDLPVVSPEAIDQSPINTVIITSWKRKIEFLQELLDINIDLEIFEPYDYLESNSIHFSNEIFANYNNVHITYWDVNNTLKIYTREKNLEMKQFYLKKLIAQLVEIKDFINVDKYLNELIDNNWDECEKYFNFRNELNILIEKIKDIALSRKQHDIIINWVDNVNAKECYSIEFFKKREEDSCVFTNAYSVSPWTHFATDTLFTGLMPIDDKIYYLSKINDSNSSVFKTLNENGYVFTYIANPGMYQRVFDEKIMESYPDSFSKIKFDDRASSECSTRLQWISLKKRLLEKNPVCHLVHNLAETHRPLIYTGIQSMSGNREDYHIPGLQFIANQLEWYDKFNNSNTYSIWLSDHGDELKSERSYEKARTNVMFIIKGPEIKSKIENRLFSNKNFSSVIDYIFNKNQNNWDKCFSDYVLYQNTDLYYLDNIINHITNQWMTGAYPHTTGVYQMRGIRTLEDMYIKYAIGKELYFRLPDENTNLLDDEKWSSRIAELKDLCGENFIDITKEPLFVNSHLLYDYLKLLPEETIKW